jgi:signal transduction histidine kinase
MIFSMETKYAPAKRVSRSRALAAYKEIAKIPLLLSQLDAGPNILLLLNNERQIVFANRNFLNLMGFSSVEEVIGQRPGEALACVHARSCSGGCGTSEFCSKCGAVNAIIAAQNGDNVVEECRVVRNDWEALDIRVWTKPMKVGEFELTLFISLDISHEKRRVALERAFFHDILNIAGNIKNLSEVFPDGSMEMNDLRGLLRVSADQLVEEILRHRELTLAETGELVVHPVRVTCRELLAEMAQLYASYRAAQGKHIALPEGYQEFIWVTDRILIKRVIGNMLKNALEASKPGETVWLGCDKEDDQVTIWVRNPSCMPRDVSLQLFKRSFSTKGPGRGLGTYSIKIITERYLSGKVSFTTSPQEGTTFFIHLPLAGPANEHVFTFP